tara:strand:+ start:378 stop:731 length:354 start_codon:yes stop_codon:yes gene_type:complete
MERGKERKRRRRRRKRRRSRRREKRREKVYLARPYIPDTIRHQVSECPVRPSPAHDAQTRPKGKKKSENGKEIRKKKGIWKAKGNGKMEESKWNGDLKKRKAKEGNVHNPGRIRELD